MILLGGLILLGSLGSNTEAQSASKGGLSHQRGGGSISEGDLPGYRFVELGGVRWGRPQGRTDPSDRLVSIVTRALDQYRVDLDRPRFRALVIDTPTYSEFARVTTTLGGARPARFVAALAFSTRGIIVINGQVRSLSLVDEYRRTLEHEVAHLVIGTAGPRVPRWYHEGLAQWLSREPLEPAREAILARWAQSDDLPELDELWSKLDVSHRSMDIFYRQCLSFVNFLSDRFGPQVHARVLAEFARGQGVQASFADATDETLAEVEERWRADLAGRASFLRHIMGFLQPFGLLAALCVGGFWYQMRIRRRALDRMEEQEEWESQLDPDQATLP